MFQKLKELKGDLTTYGIGLLQAKAFRILKQETNEALKKYNISSVDWALLGVLHEHADGLRLSEIASILGVEAPFVTQTMESVLAQGLIEKTSPHNDARVKILKLTDKGRQLVPEIETHARNQMRHLLHGATARDVLAYRKILKVIIDNSQSS